MDRHVLWLRRRIVASVAKQAAITLACTCFIATGLLLLRGTGLVISLAGGLVAGPIVSIARIVQGIRNNPLDYQYLRRFIDSPHRFTIREDRADPHPEAAELLGFYFVVAMHDPDAEPSPVFDLFQSADRRTTAAVSRASGAVSLYSKTVDGRVLVTDSRAMPAHEGLIVNAAPGQHPALLVASHRNACDAVPGGAVPEPLARKIVARAHALEHEAYSQLGPLVGPFFNVEPNRRSLGRLVARIDPSELAMLAPGTPASPRPTTVPRPDPAATADTLGSATASTTAALAPPPAPPSPSVPTQASPPPPSPPVPTFAPPPPPSPPVPTLVPPAPPSPPVPTFAPSGPPSTPSHESVSSAAAFSATTPGSDPLMVIA